MNISYSILTIVLSIFSIGLLAGDMLFVTNPDIVLVIQRLDLLICMIFFFDFLYTLYTAENKVKYFITWGWIDLLSCIPMVDELRVGRLVRLYRLFRLIRVIKTTKILMNQLTCNRANNSFVAIMLLSIITISMCSIMILVVENTPEANIKTAEDAIWWCYVTMTTVGYGDKYPVTTEGRILGSILMTIGVGVFGIFSGYVASWFLETEQQELEVDVNAIHDKIDTLQQTIDRLTVELLIRTEYNQSHENISQDNRNGHL